MAKKIKYDNLYERIISYENLRAAFYKVTEGDKKYHPDAIKFNMMLELNLVILWRDLKTGKYKVGPYTYRVVYEPKERGIWAPSFIDKIVQTAVHFVLKDICDIYVRLHR